MAGEAQPIPKSCSVLLLPTATVWLLAQQCLQPHFRVALAHQRLNRVVLQVLGQLQHCCHGVPPLLHLSGQLVDLLPLYLAQRSGLPSPQLLGIQLHVLGLLAVHPPHPRQQRRVRLPPPI